jgi:hypothetical protein
MTPMDAVNGNGKRSPDALPLEPSPKSRCIINYAEKGSNEFKVASNHLCNSLSLFEGMGLQLYSQETGYHRCPKLQLDIRTMNRVEHRCEELMVTVALAKEERQTCSVSGGAETRCIHCC